MNAPDRQIAHFNWATLVADLGSPRIARFETAIAKVNAVAARSPGYVWNSGQEMSEAARIGCPLFKENPRLIASFSVWHSPDRFRDFV
jgi:DNA-binding IclR family transcriptional regulator